MKACDLIEVDAVTASIETKLTKLKEIGELGIEIVDVKEDVDDTAAAFGADKIFFG